MHFEANIQKGVGGQFHEPLVIFWEIIKQNKKFDIVNIAYSNFCGPTPEIGLI